MMIPMRDDDDSSGRILKNQQRPRNRVQFTKFAFKITNNPIQGSIPMLSSLVIVRRRWFWILEFCLAYTHASPFRVAAAAAAAAIRLVRGLSSTFMAICDGRITNDKGEGF